LNFTCDLINDKVNQQAKYLGQRSSTSQVSVQAHRHKHTHVTDCSTWSTKNNKLEIVSVVESLLNRQDGHIHTSSITAVQ